MRRVTQVVALTFLMLIPATGASADECPTISGKAFFDFGRSGTGMANVVYGGERMLVPFRAISYDGFDILFEWDFPQGQVLIVEHSTFEPFAGPIGAFNSELDVQGPSEGHWTWSGMANRAGGKAIIKSLSGTLCIDPG